jgi:hypothetical protein
MFKSFLFTLLLIAFISCTSNYVVEKGPLNGTWKLHRLYQNDTLIVDRNNPLVYENNLEIPQGQKEWSVIDSLRLDVSLALCYIFEGKNKVEYRSRLAGLGWFYEGRFEYDEVNKKGLILLNRFKQNVRDTSCFSIRTDSMIVNTVKPNGLKMRVLFIKEQ